MPVAVQPQGTPGRYWERLDHGRVQCNLCPAHCRLRPGQRGACFVRAGAEDGMVLTTYGRSSGFCIDPIEKKPLNHFLPGTSVLSFGTAGCNLSCRFCQNWDISKSRETDTLCDAAEPETIADAAVRHGCRSVAFTYNDPVIFLEYAVDIARACRASRRQDRRRHRRLHLRGTPPGVLRRHGCGQRGPEGLHRTLLRETLRGPAARRARNPGVPETRDVGLVRTDHAPDPRRERRRCGTRRDDEVGGAELGPDVPMHFTAFHPDYKMMDHPATPLATLRRARSVARANGVRHAYTGNVHDEEGGSTYCHGCGARLVGRDGYEITAWDLTAEARCPSCGTVCAGRFEARPGRWGSHRRPVRLAGRRSP